MSRLLLTNIKSLCFTETGPSLLRISGDAMRYQTSVPQAWLLAEDGIITGFGAMSSLPDGHADKTMDCAGAFVLPAFCDSHTHIVFAAPRTGEFQDRIKGLTYEQIAANGGGILSSAARLQAMPEDELYRQAMQRIEEVIASGTGAIEIKSGYGLDTDAELKMLRVIRRIREAGKLPVRATFLAAHAYPAAFKQNHEGYIRLIIDEMLPRVSAEGLADYIDVFCELGFFNTDDTARILEAGYKYGLKPKIHANQLHRSGGVQTGVRNNAISVDHLECMGAEEIETLRNSSTIPTLLPGAAFFLGMHYQPARELLDAGLPVCLASDYNPGSCPSGNMAFLTTLACTQMKMLPEEAIWASTLNGAAAMEWSARTGSIAIGKWCNLIVTRPMESIAEIPYFFGRNLVQYTIIKGQIA